MTNTVIMMDEYIPHDVTDKASAIMQEYPIERETKSKADFGQIINRTFQQQSLKLDKGNRTKIQAKGLHQIIMGRTDISFNYTEQLVDISQTRMIAEIINHLHRTNGLQNKSLRDVLDAIEKQMDQAGLSSITTFKEQHPGDLARPRRHEIAAVLNRMRTAKVN